MKANIESVENLDRTVRDPEIFIPFITETCDSWTGFLPIPADIPLAMQSEMSRPNPRKFSSSSNSPLQAP